MPPVPVCVLHAKYTGEGKGWTDAEVAAERPRVQSEDWCGEEQPLTRARKRRGE